SASFLSCFSLQAQHNMAAFPTLAPISAPRLTFAFGSDEPEPASQTGSETAETPRKCSAASRPRRARARPTHYRPRHGLATVGGARAHAPQSAHSCHFLGISADSGLLVTLRTQCGD
uniref:WD_REPEATS_REGION domain-containing protein n=1 Tax=Macrostomum lignano TaxID=282301 RepID=A0A1I8HUS2_9PLAT